MSGLEAHYSANEIETRILAALRAAGLNPEQRLSPVALGALDHFHTGGFRASIALRDLARIRAEDRVLDIGAGLAGPARMLAAYPGGKQCRAVTSHVDLAPTLVAMTGVASDKRATITKGLPGKDFSAVLAAPERADVDAVRNGALNQPDLARGCLAFPRDFALRGFRCKMPGQFGYRITTGCARPASPARRPHCQKTRMQGEPQPWQPTFYPS